MLIDKSAGPGCYREVQDGLFKNRLLLALPPSTLDLIRPCLERVELRRGQVLQERNVPVRHAYFVESGEAHLFFQTKRDGSVGVAIVARYGVAGLPAVLVGGRSPHRCVVQIAGEAWRMAAADLHQAAASVAVRQVLDRYVQALLVQQGQMVLCASRHRLDERLSGWLLMLSHRIEGDAVDLTHARLARILGVRRPGVTAALGDLAAAGAVAGARGRVLILDRARLDGLSCGCHREIDSEYHRLLDAPLPGGK